VTANISAMKTREIASLKFSALDADDLAAVHERIRQATVQDMYLFVRWMVREIRFLEREIKFLEQRFLPN